MATTFSLKQGKTRTSHGPIPHPLTCSPTKMIRYMGLRVIGQTLVKFNQLKGNKGFDHFIILVWVQGSLFHIATGSHHVQEAWGSQGSSYRGQIQKLL